MAKADHVAAAGVRRAALPDERRREPRYTPHKLVQIVYNMSQLRVWLTQCSARGVAILSPVHMAQGEQFMIQLKLDELILLVYTVRNCRPEKENVHRIGAELGRISASPDTSYQAILSALLGQ